MLSAFFLDEFSPEAWLELLASDLPTDALACWVQKTPGKFFIPHCGRFDGHLGLHVGLERGKVIGWERV